MRLLILGLIFLGVVLSYQFLFSDGGVISAWKLKDHVAVAQAQNHVLEQRNDAIRADINDLKSGNAAIEERARNDLGMVKKGETFYQVVSHE
jgi:cell division protein FtsB